MSEKQPLDPLRGWTMKVPVDWSPPRTGNQRISEVDSQRMARLYDEGRMSLKNIAKIFDCSTWTVREHLKKYGVQVRRSGHKNEPTVTADQVQEMERLYVEEGQSLRKVAAIVGLSYETVRLHIKDLGQTKKA